MALYYADASALVKIVRAELESAALRAFLNDADIITADLALTVGAPCRPPRRASRRVALARANGGRLVTFDRAVALSAVRGASLSDVVLI